MVRHATLFLLIFSISIASQSQSQATLSWIKKYKEAIKLYNSPRASEQSDSVAFQIFSDVIGHFQNETGHDSILFDSYFTSALIEMARKNQKSAIRLFLHTIMLKERKDRWSDSLLFQPFLFAGSCYYELNDLDSATYWYKQAELLNQRYPGLPETERLFNKIGVLYFETGDYRKSIQYFRKALSQVQNQSHPNPYFIVNYENNIASALRKLQENEEALKIYKNLLSYEINKNELLHNIGATYLNEGKPKEAITFLLKVQYNTRIKLNDIGHAYLLLGKTDSAHYFLQKAMVALPLLKKEIKDLDYGITLRWLGDLSLKEGRFSEALSFFQQSIIQIDYDFNDTLATHNPTSFQGLHNSYLLFNVLAAKGFAFNQLFKSNHSYEMLKYALAAYLSSINLARHVEKTFNSDEARLFFSNQAVEAYRNAIDISLQLYEFSHERNYLDQAFSLMENSKASVLLAGIQQLSLESIVGLPQDLIREERNYKMAITKLNLELNNLTTQQEISEAQKKLTDLEIKLSEIQSKMDENPRYQSLKFDNSDVSIGKVQSFMQKNMALVSYYFLEERLLILYVTDDRFGYQISNPTINLSKKIKEFRIILEENKRDRKKENELCRYLFGQLLAPIFNKIIEKERWVIIPHKEISFIPFESLRENSSDNILLASHSITYQFSANFLYNLKSNPAKRTEYGVLGIAPFANSNLKESFPTLPNSKKEIEGWKGLTLLDSEATKQHFFESYKSYPVIHLATHAAVNDQDPLNSFIAFYATTNQPDSVHRLYEQEIYNLDMNSTKLIILSACETGSGELINNEGIMSMSRAFSYAGCKSAITSLWKASDVSTAYIGRRLHYYLSHGYSKDEALRKSKLDFLKDNGIDPSYKSTSSWAHLIFIGDPSPIGENSHEIIWVIIISFILLSIFAMLLYKKNRTQN